jgi:hypothetical protein
MRTSADDAHPVTEIMQRKKTDNPPQLGETSRDREAAVLRPLAGIVPYGGAIPAELPYQIVPDQRWNGRYARGPSEYGVLSEAVAPHIVGSCESTIRTGTYPPWPQRDLCTSRGGRW